MFYIWEAAVTDFYGVPVEDFAQFVVLGEVPKHLKKQYPHTQKPLKRVGTTQIYSSIQSLPRSAMKTKQENDKSHGLIPTSTAM